MSEQFTFSFDASVDKVQTLADGGIKVSLLLAETDIPQAALFMECKRTGKVLQVDCKTRDNSNVIQARGVRKSTRTPAQKPSVDEDPGDGGQQDDNAEGWPEGGEEADYS